MNRKHWDARVSIRDRENFPSKEKLFTNAALLNDMPRGSKASYLGKQKRQASHIEHGYENRGVKPQEAKRRAWATVNKMTGGGKRSGSGRGKAVNLSPARKGGRIGGRAHKTR
ncbi:MAG TPA: plasmid stabilization protein [Verrucomicrobiae bacterium]